MKLYLANAGDSKAVLISKNEIRDITTEHRASNEAERLRVESQGGVIIVHKSRSLVQGSLEITRSLGDRKYKKYISCEPDIFELDITNDDQMVIMATDGFWDVTLTRFLDSSLNSHFLLGYEQSRGDGDSSVKRI